MVVILISSVILRLESSIGLDIQEVHILLLIRYGYGQKVFTLDQSSERYGEVEQQDYEEVSFDCNLHILEGFLSVFCYSRNGNMELWSMMGYDMKEFGCGS